jgi:predicted dehydrogenase
MTRSASRRQFLAAGASACAVPYFWAPPNATAAEDKTTAKSDRLQIGQIGCGGRGNGIANQAAALGDLVAVCDVDQGRAEVAKAKQGRGKSDIYTDYRKLLDRKEIDAVTIGTPDHWHTKIAIEAMLAGKDVYCEKPLTLTVDEGKLICKHVRQTGRVFQVGTQQRSTAGFQTAVALCHSGRLGKIRKLTVAIGGGSKGGPFKPETPPANLDWDMWLGQTPLVEYIKERCHYTFRWWYEYSGGKLTDWGAHHVDIAHWAIGASATGPVSFEGTGELGCPFDKGYPVADDCYNTATKFNIKCQFADGIEMMICDRWEKGADKFENGILIEGDQGRIFVSRSKLTGKPVDDLKENPLPPELFTRLYKGNTPTSHMENFFHCVKTRGECVSDPFSHHRALTSCHLANIAIRLGRRIQWDPTTERILNDPEAATFLRREQRKGFEIPA